MGPGHAFTAKSGAASYFPAIRPRARNPSAGMLMSKGRLMTHSLRRPDDGT